MPKQHQVSLKDLALELNVSVATVSRALHDNPEISRDLREKVQELARRRGYRPNPFAQSLRKGAPQIIGVITPKMNSHYHSSVIAGIEDEARKQGYSIICTNSHENPDDETRCINDLLAMHVVGIICSLTQDTSEYTKFEQLSRLNVPLVFYARTCMQDTFSSVISNDIIASQQACDHLLKQGFRRIGFVGGPNHLDMVKRRKKGFIAALHEAKVPVEPKLFKCGTLDRETARQSALDLIRNEHVDALLAVNYDTLYGCLSAIRECHKRIPQDIALMGFADDPDVSYLTPPITSVVDQSYDIGIRSCQMLLKHISGDKKVTHEVLPMHINIRKSTKK